MDAVGVLNWILFAVNVLLAGLCCVFGTKAMLKLSKSLKSHVFKTFSIFIIAMLVVDGLSIVANFFIVLYWNWSKHSLQDMVSIGWRVLHPLSLVCVLALFMYRIHLVFHNTAYRYPSCVFICFILAVMAGCSLMVVATILNLSQQIELSQVLATAAVLFYICLSVFVCCLFVHGLFKVTASSVDLGTQRMRSLSAARERHLSVGTPTSPSIGQSSVGNNTIGSTTPSFNECDENDQNVQNVIKPVDNEKDNNSDQEKDVHVQKVAVEAKQIGDEVNQLDIVLTDNQKQMVALMTKYCIIVLVSQMTTFFMGLLIVAIGVVHAGLEVSVEVGLLFVYLLYTSMLVDSLINIQCVYFQYQCGNHDYHLMFGKLHKRLQSYAQKVAQRKLTEKCKRDLQ